MAGDWTRHVIAGLGTNVAEPLRRFEAGYLWMQVLRGQSELEYMKVKNGTNWVRIFQSCIDP